MKSVQENCSTKPSKKKTKNKRKQCIENGTGNGTQTDRLSENLKENLHITTGNGSSEQQNGIDSHYHEHSRDHNTNLKGTTALINGGPAKGEVEVCENGHEARLNGDCNISSSNSPKDSNNCHSTTTTTTTTSTNGTLGEEERDPSEEVVEAKESAMIVTNGSHASCRSTPSPQSEPPVQSAEKKPESKEGLLENDENKVDKLSPTVAQPATNLENIQIEYKEYESELQMHDIMRLIQAELSEPYSIYTYRYFIYNWPKLCFLAAHGNEYVGAIVCKLDMHMNVKRGYIAMLAVRREYRKLKIGTTLVQKAIEAMLADNADEVVLETEMRNIPALRLYENLGFVRDKRLFRYYLNGVDALRLKLWFR